MERSADYRVNLEVFEGPLDLLLYLIRKDDIDITDIPIAFILEEYIKYLDTLKEMNIDMAGDFLLMAAELAYIKSRMLLPQDEEKAEEEDPRTDLVRRLLEYQRYKEAAESISGRSQLNRDVFVPLGLKKDPETDIEESAELEKTDVYKLLDAFARMIMRLPKEKFHDVAVDRISVNERIFQLIDKIKKDAVLRLDELLEGPITRYQVVITFLALLEMARLKMVSVIQADHSSELCVKGIMEKIDDSNIVNLIRPKEGG